MSDAIQEALDRLDRAVREEISRRLLPGGVGTLATEISAARTAKGLSLQDVADLSGYTKAHIWELEKGRALNPTIGLLAALSEALGVPFVVLAQAALVGIREKEAAAA